ncbi:MAG: hypothetical protein ACYC64_09320 [Armatimonadota bacterium]
MSELLQWVIVGISAIIAALYLYKRLAKSTKGECSGCCGCKSAGSHSESDCAACDMADGCKDMLQ